MNLYYIEYNAPEKKRSGVPAISSHFKGYVLSESPENAQQKTITHLKTISNDSLDYGSVFELVELKKVSDQVIP